MSKRVILPGLAAAALLVAGGCYQDDTTASFEPNRGKPLARVLLTDGPFPYVSVASVNIHVVRIEANVDPDTSEGGQWVPIAEPRRAFNLLALQQGTTAFVAEGELPAGQYRAIRMTIDTSLSSIIWNSPPGIEARVNWQNYSGSNEMPLYALVEYPLDVPAEGAEIVIDFDVGRSFLYDFFGTREFTFASQLRAVNSAKTGAIAGTVSTTSPNFGGTGPVSIPSANITVCSSDPCEPPNANIVATGRSDAGGHYVVAFLRAGSYTVRIEQPEYPVLVPVVRSNVQVVVGDTTELSESLPDAGSAGAYIQISGPTSVVVGGRLALVAVVGDSNGNPLPWPQVSWTSSDSSVAIVTSESKAAYVDTAFVDALQVGFATLTAMSSGLSDSRTVQVIGSPAPVATVTVVPGSADIALADSVPTAYFRADLRDAEGNVIYDDRPVSWFSTDTSVFVVLGAGGKSATVLARNVGSAALVATSEGKTGRATVTVH